MTSKNETEKTCYWIQTKAKTLGWIDRQELPATTSREDAVKQLAKFCEANPYASSRLILRVDVVL